MTDFVPFFCSEHGQVIQANVNSRIECNCGKECAPKGLTVRAHVARYNESRRPRSPRRTSQGPM